MADIPEQVTLNEHVKACPQCLKAKSINETCQTGRILARILESVKTR